jgi:putative serine protease PepD
MSYPSNRLERKQMFRKPTSIVAAAVVLAAGVGAGVGVGGYAALSGGKTKTTTVVQAPVPANASPTAATKSGSVASVYKDARAGVVEVVTTTRGSSSNSPFPFGGGSSGSSRAQGSGFVYDSAGHLITNYHVVQGETSVQVVLADGSKEKATVVGSDPSSDLAVLKVDAPSSDLHPLSLGDSSALQVGDGVVAIGAPFGLEETVTSGIVSALDRSISSETRYTIPGVIQTDAAINHGNSGGPLLNLAGQVVGVTTQIASESGGNDGVGFAIPSNAIKSVASQILNGKKVEHPYLGVSIGDATSRSGAAVGSITSGSPAADAGLKKGDVITRFGDSAITDANDLTEAVGLAKPRDKVKVTYVRGGETKTTTVTVGTRPS